MRYLAQFCAACFLLPSTAEAERQEAFSLSIGGDFQQFDYQEFNDQGRLLDREHGLLPGLMLGASRLGSQWAVAGQVSCHAGGVTYTGQTNSGVPLTTITNQHIINLELRAERHVDALDKMRPALFFGAAHRVWRRDIRPSYTASGQPVSGLLEIYRWWHVFLGAKATVYEGAEFVWNVDARITRVLVPTMVVDYAGRYDNPRLSLGERWGFWAGAPLSFKLRYSTKVTMEPYLETFLFGRSAVAPLTSQGLPAGAVYEPDSKTRNYGIRIAIEEYF